MITPANYNLSLHDALPISDGARGREAAERRQLPVVERRRRAVDDPVVRARDADERTHEPVRTVLAQPLARDRPAEDRKSTRLNSSHGYISYAVFCLIKKKI